MGFGDGPDASDVKAWAKALKTSGGLFAPIVMERLGDLAMSLYRRSRYQAELASNGNLVLQSVLESAGPNKLKDAVSKEIRRCVNTVLRDQTKRSKGLETVIPVILGPVIDAARKQDEDEESDEEEENKNLTTYRLLCNTLCSKDSYTRVSIKIFMDLLDQGTWCSSEVFERGVRARSARISIISHLMCQLRHNNTMLVAHSYRKKLTRKSTLEYELDCDENTNTNARTQVRIWTNLRLWHCCDYSRPLRTPPKCSQRFLRWI